MSAAKLSVNWLPEDLVVEVFLRLPRKSLLRFRLVSKGLLNSIDSPVFKKRYDILHNSVSDFSVMIIEADQLFSMDFRLPDSLNSSMEKAVSVPHKKNPRFIGSCKGIICVMISPTLTFTPGQESYILSNPFNGTYQEVKCSNLYPLNFNFAIAMGFGYDCVNDDYKIVRMEPEEHGTVRYLDVYSMKSDSWKQVLGEFSPGCSTQDTGICSEGAIHWLWLSMDGYRCIAAFDLETETFRSFQLPPQLFERRQLWSIHDFGGRLCVVVMIKSDTIVWVMEEYGTETSWTRLFIAGNDISFVVGYFPLWDSARLLCLGSDSRTLFWLNTQDGSKEDIKILKLPRQQPSQQIKDQVWYKTETESWVCVRSPLRLRCSESQND